MTDQPKAAAKPPLRWLVEVVYRTKSGPIDVEYAVDSAVITTNCTH